MFSIMTHHNNVARFGKLCDMFKERENSKK
jgi:hypothetical protein